MLGVYCWSIQYHTACNDCNGTCRSFVVIQAHLSGAAPMRHRTCHVLALQVRGIGHFVCWHLKCVYVIQMVWHDTLQELPNRSRHAAELPVGSDAHIEQERCKVWADLHIGTVCIYTRIYDTQSHATRAVQNALLPFDVRLATIHNVIARCKKQNLLLSSVVVKNV